MNNKEDIKREISELAPRLGMIEKKNPFKSPDYYFQGLPDKILQRAKEQPVSWTDKLETWLNDTFEVIFRPRYAIPASAFLLTLIVAVNFFKTQEQAQSDITLPLAEISTEEINAFAMENFDEVDLMTISGSKDGVNGLIPSDITTDDLKDYLQNNSDNQTLEEDIL